MRSSKSRSRNKSNRQRTLGNIVNRVFDSSGPEGKVRGTPQQIIEKYLTLARDAQLSNDRVAEQSFLQHAEHYTRLLGEAQREQAERQQHQNGFSRDDDREDGNGQHAEGGNGQQGGQNGHRHDRDENRGENRNDNRGENRRDRDNRDNRRDDNRREDNRRDDNRDNRRDDRSERRDDRPQTSEPVTQDQGLPPVIAEEPAVEAGPVETPESSSTASPELPFAAPAPEPAPAPAATPAPEVATAPEGDAAEEAPAPRRRAPRSTTPRSTTPRTRRKPAAEGDKAAEKASGE
ncbi:DUF4167 domain-containing protein [Paracoccus laeviglucosivorans]|uniref:DUF4167 domain-containing protein n=1 Tax=Paracoccus laeviglucosivorans TaxID=1197861 RepID=A0A521CD17_9RHOB|nr:DUF4167 domain-containing protein [Paracoccus laeviglucosivorans]SMO57309.1 protein of unknown function [Paracoccus laeviglucosivorans]